MPRTQGNCENVLGVGGNERDGRRNQRGFREKTARPIEELIPLLISVLAERDFNYEQAVESRSLQKPAYRYTS